MKTASKSASALGRHFFRRGRIYAFVMVMLSTLALLSSFSSHHQAQYEATSTVQFSGKVSSLTATELEVAARGWILEDQHLYASLVESGRGNNSGTSLQQARSQLSVTSVTNKQASKPQIILHYSSDDQQHSVAMVNAIARRFAANKNRAESIQKKQAPEIANVEASREMLSEVQDRVQNLKRQLLDGHAKFLQDLEILTNKNTQKKQSTYGLRLHGSSNKDLAKKRVHNDILIQRRADLQQEITSLSASRERFLRQLKPKHPKIVGLKSEIQLLEDQLAKLPKPAEDNKANSKDRQPESHSEETSAEEQQLQIAKFTQAAKMDLAILTQELTLAKLQEKNLLENHLRLVAKIENTDVTQRWEVLPAVAATLNLSIPSGDLRFWPLLISCLLASGIACATPARKNTFQSAAEAEEFLPVEVVGHLHQEERYTTIVAPGTWRFARQIVSFAELLLLMFLVAVTFLALYDSRFASELFSNPVDALTNFYGYITTALQSLFK